MVNIIRRFQQPLMIAITVLVIIGFTFFYSNTRTLNTSGAERVATVYGRGVSVTQYQRGARKFELGRDLMLFELLQTLAEPARTMDEAQKNFAFNSIVLEHEAERLGIATTDEEAAAAIKAMPVFQTTGQFDPARYTQIVDGALTPRGFSPEQLEELVREDLLLKKLKALLGVSTAPAPAEVREAFERDNQKTVSSVVRLKLADFSKDTKVSDDDVKKAFEERKAVFNAPEKRKVKVAALTIETTDKPLAGKERVEALKKLADKAGDFAQAMIEKGATFDAVAKTLEVPVKETAEFSDEAPPAEFDGSPAVAQAASKLTKQEPTSDIIGTDKGYYVLQLSGVTPARPLTFEEAKDKLAENLKQERVTEALNLKGAEIRAKIDAEMKAGKSFADAASAAGAKAEPFPAFSRRDPKLNEPDGREVMMSTLDLSPGQLSTFLPTFDGGVLVYLEQRAPIDPAEFEKEKASTAANLSRGRREALFSEWLKARRKEAGVPAAALPSPA